jgi:hypothetical protein
MADTSGGLIESIFALPGQFADVVGGGPVEASLLILGALLTVFAIGVFGFLATGGIVDAVIEALPDEGPRYPRER